MSDYFSNFKNGLDAKQVKIISDEVVEFIKEKTQSNKVWLIDFVLDQAKTDIKVENKLKHDSRCWRSNPHYDEC